MSADLLSTFEAADTLRLSKCRVLQLVKRGSLQPAMRLAERREYRFTVAELERYKTDTVNRRNARKVARDGLAVARAYKNWVWQESRNCPVCVCDTPDPDGIGECQRCFRPYRQETFADCRAAWRAHLGLPPDAANARGKGPAVPPPAGPTLESQ